MSNRIPSQEQVVNTTNPSNQDVTAAGTNSNGNVVAFNNNNNGLLVSSSMRGCNKKSSGGAIFKYMECQKNHAAGIGENATDGCGEFMVGGEESTLEALTCAACNCHRNFHRKIIHHYQYYEAADANSPYCGPSSSPVLLGGGQRIASSRPDIKVEGVGAVKKRFRTKFTQEQKEKMFSFAEKSGWKIQKLDDSEVAKFCQEIGIKRNVLKVWMHNNKYHQSSSKKKTITASPPSSST